VFWFEPPLLRGKNSILRIMAIILNTGLLFVSCEKFFTQNLLCLLLANLYTSKKKHFTMRKIIVLISLAAIMTGCASSGKLMQQGRYDAAVEKSVKKLRKNPANENEIRVLERSYMLAMEQNVERINFLNRQNDPRFLDEMIGIYNTMKRRQSLVRTITPLQLTDRMVQFPYVDYDEQIVSLQNAAADFLYNNAIGLMRRNDKESYRKAHQELLKVKQYSHRFTDVDKLLLESKMAGMSLALVMVQNQTHLNLGNEFLNSLLTIDPKGLDSEWVEFHFRDLDEGINYDYYVVVNLRAIEVSPDLSRDTDRMIKKTVNAGFEYVLDANGNVAKDTLGNDIKVPKFKEISCALIETHQQKRARIDGDIEFVSLNPQRLLKKEPVGASSTFDHFSARAIGDLNALDDEMREMVSRKPIPFPNDAEMIFRTAESMRIAIRQGITRNRNFIR
jgi:hypothetical protein